MHFASSRHVTLFRYDCPNNYNPSDFVMHISQTETHEILSEKGMFQLSAERKRSLTGAIHPSITSDLSEAHSIWLTTLWGGLFGADWWPYLQALRWCQPVLRISPRSLTRTSVCLYGHRGANSSTGCARGVTCSALISRTFVSMSLPQLQKSWRVGQDKYLTIFSNSFSFLPCFIPSFLFLSRELLNIRRDTTALAARFGITIFLRYSSCSTLPLLHLHLMLTSLFLSLSVSFSPSHPPDTWVHINAFASYLSSDNLLHPEVHLMISPFMTCILQPPLWADILGGW